MCFSGAGLALLAPVDREELRQAKLRVCRNTECVHYQLPPDEGPPPEPWHGERLYRSPEGAFWIEVFFQVEPDGTYVRITWRTQRFGNLLPGDVYRAEIETSAGKPVASRTFHVKHYVERTINYGCGPTCRNAVLVEPVE